MRMIHRIRPHEKFVASGRYKTYNHHDSIVEGFEDWSIHEQPDGSQIIRADRLDEKQSATSGALIEVLRSKKDARWAVERYYFYRYSTKGLIKENGIFWENLAQVTKDKDGETQVYDIALPDGCIIAVPGVVCSDFVMQLQVGVENALPVFWGGTIDLSIKNYYLFEAPTSEEVNVGDKTIQTQRYAMMAEGTRDLLSLIYSNFDSYGILLNQSMFALEISLNPYARRPEPKS